MRFIKISLLSIISLQLTMIIFLGINMISINTQEKNTIQVSSTDTNLPPKELPINLEEVTEF